MKIGDVVKLYVKDIIPAKPKFCIIIGLDKQSVATIFINTEIRQMTQLPIGIQASQILLMKEQCNFLDHDSFADCSTIREWNKMDLNNLLQAEPGRIHGEISPNTMSSILETFKKSKTIPKAIKVKYIQDH